MFPFSNENSKIISYLCYIININSIPFQEPNSSFFFGKKSIDIESEFVNIDSESNLNAGAHVIHTTHSIESESFECVTLDLIERTRESIMYNADQQYYPSLLSKSKEGYSEHNIYKLHKLEESSSSEQSEEIDIETVNTSDENIHSNLVLQVAANNPIENLGPQNPNLQKYFHNGIFRPYIPEEVDDSCSTSKYNHTNLYDYDTTRFDHAPSSSNRNPTESTVIDFFKTNETNHSIHGNEVFPQPFDYQWNFPSDGITSQYFLNRSLTEKNINSNNVSFKNTIHIPDGMETTSDARRHFINITDDDSCSTYSHSRRSYESSGFRNLLNEPPRKMSRHISTDVEDYSGIVSSIPQIIRTTDKNIMHAGYQPENNHALLSTHNADEDLIKMAITGTNTQKKCDNRDCTLSHLKSANSNRIFEVSMKDCEGINNDESSLKKITEDDFTFNFILKDTSISWSFNRIIELDLFLKISCTSIIATDFIFAASVFNIDIKTLFRRYYSFSIPIFHMIDFVCSNNIEYFRILVRNNKYAMMHTLGIFIYQSKTKVGLKLQLKCPRIHDFKQLINKFLETRFRIYTFPVVQSRKVVQFHILSSSELINEMSLNEYIEDVTENPLNIKTKFSQKHNSTADSHINERTTNEKKNVCWETGVKIVYDICEIFCTNIKQILIIIDHDSKTLESKKIEINGLLNQIIQKIKKVPIINYPRKIGKYHQRESELMSFYAACTNEAKDVFEWWIKYIFVVADIQYIQNC